jgi:hypothetical protein
MNHTLMERCTQLHPMRHGTGPGARGSLLTNVLGQLSPLVAYFRLVALRDQVRVCDKTRVQHDMRAVRGSKEIAAMCASLHGGRPYRSPSNAPLHGATRSVVSGQRGQHGLQAPPHGLHPRRTNGLMRERPGQALIKPPLSGGIIPPTHARCSGTGETGPRGGMRGIVWENARQLGGPLRKRKVGTNLRLRV